MAANDTIFVKHSSGAVHSITGRKATTLRKECLAGRGMQEIVALRLAGYEGFMDETSTSNEGFEDLDALPDYFARKAGK